MLRFYVEYSESHSYIDKEVAWCAYEIEWAGCSHHTVGITALVENVVDVYAGCYVAIGVAK